MFSKTKGVVQEKPSGCEWKIERFFADCKGAGDYYKSPLFTVQYADKVTNWILQVFPKGINTKGLQNNVSLFVFCKSENDTKVTVDCQCSIMSEKNNRSTKSKALKLTSTTNSCGWHVFGNQDILHLINGYLIDDTLTILCEITFHSADPDYVTEQLKVYDNLLDKIGKESEDYESLLENNSFSDVTFIIRDNKMYLHKAILSCRNLAFRAMFEGEKKEKKQKLMMDVVNITDIDYEVMKEVFRFIYSGKVENIENLAKDLLIAADKYSVVELKALCEKTLYKNLTVDNAIECFKLTETCDTIHLKTLVIQFISAHFKDLVNKPGFADLNSRVMHQIIQSIAAKN